MYGVLARLLSGSVLVAYCRNVFIALHQVTVGIHVAGGGI